MTPLEQAQSKLNGLLADLERLQAWRRDAADGFAQTGKGWLELGLAERAVDAKLRECSKARDDVRINLPRLHYTPQCIPTTTTTVAE